MTRDDFRPTTATNPSRSRMRYVESQLQADAEAILREMAFVLKMTQRVREEILSQSVEAETVGA